MSGPDVYDVAIAGGGLAGLALSIQLAGAGYTVILFEKEEYPFHRVCGEYVSCESWNFLESLGLPLASMALPKINQLSLSTSSGRVLGQPLPLGGFGISRFQLDHLLAKKAMDAGVVVMQGTRVADMTPVGNKYEVVTSNGNFSSRLACGSFGKRSNLDIQWKRPFISRLKGSLNNYVGVKYHVRGDFRNDTVYLHLFERGYVGLVRIGNNEYNLCYLTSAVNLKKAGNCVAEMERSVLSRNPRIRELFERAEKIDERPVAISQISFDSKEQARGGILMLGDAAGMITPLCGNGMSMALHSSKIAAKFIRQRLDEKINSPEMVSSYAREWKENFASRMKTGRMIQRALAIPWMASALVTAGTLSPALLKTLIRRTHGSPF